ncbi:hypothetical protein L6452_36384 [Arctium lappa]|uniref:Uncharacterized protein n=1 Tax=Arctium lappa TaxID=4217 RepID=A0ACB8Y9N1_ARCLA|nr:hypothetical protein L6452_36384 [Arctium lappa]
MLGDGGRDMGSKQTSKQKQLFFFSDVGCSLQIWDGGGQCDGISFGGFLRELMQWAGWAAEEEGLPNGYWAHDNAGPKLLMLLKENKTRSPTDQSD